jgi:hypothetical protein
MQHADDFDRRSMRAVEDEEASKPAHGHMRTAPTRAVRKSLSFA